jgi:hypothetical protein
MKLYTEEQVLNTANAIRNYLKNYPEKFHESMINKHLTALIPIELPSDDEINEMGIDVIIYNDTKRGWFVEGLKFMRNKIQGGEQ